MTGVLDASGNSKPSPTALTIDGTFGRGSGSRTWLLIAKAWLRSCTSEELLPRMMSAPPGTPPEARLASASEATSNPAVDLKATTPRSGSCMESQSVADRRALMAASIGDAVLQQGLGDGEDAFAAEGASRAEAQMLGFLL